MLVNCRSLSLNGQMVNFQGWCIPRENHPEKKVGLLVTFSLPEINTCNYGSLLGIFLC